jgi:hypothetical protein
MNYDHRFFLWTEPPKKRLIKGSNIEALFMGESEDGEGDCGGPAMCPIFTRLVWPKAYEMLRPLQYVEVPPLVGGDPIGEVIKP